MSRETTETTAERLPRLLRESADWCDQQQYYLKLAQDQIDQERATRAAAYATLREIAEQDLVEIALDPDWPRRIAKEALGHES